MFVRAIAEWRQARRLAADPLDAFRQSGYLERITAARGERNLSGNAAYA